MEMTPSNHPDIESLNSLISAFNEKSQKIGLPRLLVLRPQDCIGQEKNARYFMPETFQLLVDNVKHDGRLESVPLVCPDEKQAGKFRIISGHHRIDAAKQAKISAVIVMVITPKDRNEILSKQLSHNSLVGQDDKIILKELYDEISTIEAKIASGLTDEIEKIEYTSLNFRLGNTRDWRELSFIFSQKDAEDLDSILKEITELAALHKDMNVTACDLAHYDAFVEGLAKIKPELKIKNNAVAVMAMAKITKQYLENRQYEQKDQTDTGADSESEKTL